MFLIFCWASLPARISGVFITWPWAAPWGIKAMPTTAGAGKQSWIGWRDPDEMRAAGCSSWNPERGQRWVCCWSLGRTVTSVILSTRQSFIDILCHAMCKHVFCAHYKTCIIYHNLLKHIKTIYNSYTSSICFRGHNPFSIGFSNLIWVALPRWIDWFVLASFCHFKSMTFYTHWPTVTKTSSQGIQLLVFKPQVC